MHRSKEKKTQIHERRRGCIHCGSIEYTLNEADAFTVLWWNTSFLRHTHEWRHHDYYNEELQWLPSTSMYRMHEGRGGARGVPGGPLPPQWPPKISQVFFWKSYIDHWQLPLLENWPLQWPPQMKMSGSAPAWGSWRLRRT